MTVNELVNKVQLKLLYKVEPSIISMYVEEAIQIASNISCYKECELPESFKYYVIETVVEALNKRGSEEKSSENALGVSASFTFKDMESSLRHKLRGKKNPKSLTGKY